MTPMFVNKPTRPVRVVVERLSVAAHDYLARVVGKIASRRNRHHDNLARLGVALSPKVGEILNRLSRSEKIGRCPRCISHAGFSQVYTQRGIP